MSNDGNAVDSEQRGPAMLGRINFLRELKERNDAARSKLEREKNNLEMELAKVLCILQV